MVFYLVFFRQLVLILRNSSILVEMKEIVVDGSSVNGHDDFVNIIRFQTKITFKLRQLLALTFPDFLKVQPKCSIISVWQMFLSKSQIQPQVKILDKPGTQCPVTRSLAKTFQILGSLTLLGLVNCASIDSNNAPVNKTRAF